MAASSPVLGPVSIVAWMITDAACAVRVIWEGRVAVAEASLLVKAARSKDDTSPATTSVRATAWRTPCFPSFRSTGGMEGGGECWGVVEAVGSSGEGERGAAGGVEPAGGRPRWGGTAGGGKQGGGIEGGGKGGGGEGGGGEGGGGEGGGGEGGGGEGGMAIACCATCSAKATRPA